MTTTRPSTEPTRHDARPAPTGSGRATRLAPGLAVVAVATVVVLAGSRIVPTVSPLVVALVLGAVAGSVVVGRARRPRTAARLAGLRPGIAWTTTTVLRTGVVLLGLQLSVPEVLALGWRGLLVVTTTLVVTFAGTLALGRLLRVPRATSLLVATGFSICGAAAISAMQGVVARPGRTPAQVREDDDAVATALALVTVYGTLAIVALPWLAGLLHLDDAQAGLWIGASVQEVAQVVTAAGTVSAAALATATVAKLARVALLAPIVTGAGLVAARTGAPGGRTRVAPVPWFVVGFLVAVGLRSAGVVPQPVLDAGSALMTVAFVAAMFALGLGVDVPRLVRTGRRALVLGALSAAVVTTTSLAAVLLLT